MHCTLYFAVTFEQLLSLTSLFTFPRLFLCIHKYSNRKLQSFREFNKNISVYYPRCNTLYLSSVNLSPISSFSRDNDHTNFKSNSTARKIQCSKYENKEFAQNRLNSRVLLLSIWTNSIFHVSRFKFRSFLDTWRFLSHRYEPIKNRSHSTVSAARNFPIFAPSTVLGPVSRKWRESTRSDRSNFGLKLVCSRGTIEEEIVTRKRDFRGRVQPSFRRISWIGRVPVSLETSHWETSHWEKFPGKFANRETTRWKKIHDSSVER